MITDLFHQRVVGNLDLRARIASLEGAAYWPKAAIVREYLSEFARNGFMVATRNPGRDRRALLEVGLFDERMDFEEDWDLWLRVHERYGASGFATTTAPVCYYWINHEERQQKRRKATVDGMPVREYFRQRYGASPAD